MTIKEKILAGLKTKYTHLGLSPKVLETMTNKIAKRVGDDETKIDAEVIDAEDDLNFFQSIADQNRTLAKKIEDMEKASGKKPKVETEEPEVEEEQDDEEMPSWAKKLMKNQENISQELSGFKKEAQNKTSQQKLIEKLTDLKVSKSYYEGMIEDREFENDEAIEAFATKMKEREDNYLATNKLTKLGEASEVKTPESVFIKSDKDKDGAMSSAEQKFIDSFKPKEATAEQK